MKITTTRFHAVTAALVLAALAACSSGNPYKRPHDDLAAATAYLQAGEYAQAVSTAEGLLGYTGEEAGDFMLQRFFGAFLLVQAHAASAVGEPFINEPGSSDRGLGGGGNGGMRGSETAHLLAAMLYASYGDDWASAAARSGTQMDGQPMLPAPWDSFEVESAQLNMDICGLVVYARLGFEDRVERILDESENIHSLETAESLLDSARIPDEIRPWVYYTLYEYLRKNDDAPTAYLYGIRTIEAAGAARGTLDAEATDAIAKWIKSGSRYIFKCPRCHTPVVPELQACQNDQTPHVEFYAELSGDG